MALMGLESEVNRLVEELAGLEELTREELGSILEAKNKAAATLLEVEEGIAEEIKGLKSIQNDKQRAAARADRKGPDEARRRKAGVDAEVIEAEVAELVERKADRERMADDLRAARKALAVARSEAAGAARGEPPPKGGGRAEGGAEEEEGIAGER